MDLPTAQEKARTEDYLDFMVTLIDNGDDKLCLSGNIKSFFYFVIVGPSKAAGSNLICTMN